MEGKRKAKRSPWDTFIVYCPVNFDVSILQKGLSGKRDYKTNFVDAALYIIHLLIKFQEQKDKRDEFEADGYFRLNATLLKQSCGEKYVDVLVVLKVAGVIEGNGRYSRKRHISKGYRLTAEYNSAEVRSVPLSARSNVNKFCIGRQKIKEQANKESLQKLSHITKWFDAKRLTIALESVHDVIEFYQHKLKNRISPTCSTQQRKQIESAIHFRYNNAIDSIKKINAGHFNLRSSGEDRRLHHAVASLKKEFRSFLLFDGKPLVSIDIRASQPYLLTQVFFSEFYSAKTINSPSKAFTLNKHYKHLYKAIQEERPINLPAFLQMPVNQRHIKKSSFAFHSKIDWEAGFYDQLIGIDKVYSGKSFFKTKEATKRDIMSIFYDAQNKRRKYYAGFVRFESHFPQEVAVIEYFDKLSRKHDTGFLPILMQRMESYLVLNKVCSRIAKKYPEAPIIPIHDSVLTTQEYVDQVKHIMESTLLKETGLKPGIRVETSLSIEDAIDSLEDLVEEDYQEILIKSRKKIYPFRAIKPPLLSQVPQWKGEVIDCSRYH